MSDASLVGEEYVRAKISVPEACEGYMVLDAVGEKVGKVEKVFLNGHDEVEYIKIKAGLLWKKPILLPVEMVSVDDEKKTLALR